MKHRRKFKYGYQPAVNPADPDGINRGVPPSGPASDSRSQSYSGPERLEVTEQIELLKQRFELPDPPKPTHRPANTVRLSVNLAPDVAQALKRLSGRWTITEGVRRAIAIWDFLDAQKQQGYTLAVIEPSTNGGDDRVREIILI